MSTPITFKDGEQIVGYVEIDSGSILFVDGIVESDLKIDLRNRLVVNVNLEPTRLPIIATLQRGQRFLLIPLDAAEPQVRNTAETIETEDHAELEKPEEPKDVK